MWLLALAMMTTIFTVGLTGRYKDENIELQQELLDSESKHNAEVYKIKIKYETKIAALLKELEIYRKAE